jgi:hypothetical protein
MMSWDKTFCSLFCIVCTQVNTRKDAEASKARSLMRILQQNEAVGFVEEEEEEEEKEKEEARQGELIT